ncbi:hypothetical protein DL93DRAFT_2234355 [Clavulina sp. PMI_390]|nr:hypothetical protein DL93DRAFT_2234355 [Clavulina sp. PMI_390]
MIRDEDAARELICRSLGPLARRLGGKHSKTESVTFRKAACICLDLTDFIESTRNEDTKSIVKELIETQLTRKVAKVTIQIASFAARSDQDLSKPGAVFSTPIYWCLLPVLAQLSTLFDVANDRCPSADLDQELIELQNSVYALAPIWRKDNNIYRRFHNLGGDALESPQLPLLIQTIITHVFVAHPHAHCNGEPHHTPAFLADSLHILLRVRFSIIDASTYETSQENLKTNTFMLSVYSKALICHPNGQPLFKGLDLSQWASRPHQHIVSHFIHAVAKSNLEELQDYRSSELVILAQLVMMDHSDDMLCALAELDYITPSISYAKKALPTLRRSANHDVAYEFKAFMASWCLMVVNPKSMAAHHRLVETMLDLEFLFLVEALVRLSEGESTKNATFLSEQLIEAIQAALAARKDPGFYKCASQIALINSRTATDRSAHTLVKQMWSRLAERAEELARDLPIETHALPSSESVCGLPGCTSLVSAELHCKRCKQQRYCSVDCQKPDWRRHKKFCKAAEE